MTEELEKLLERILAETKSGTAPATLQDLGIAEEDGVKLQAHGVIKLTPAGDDELYVTPTAKGLTYASDKAKRAEDALQEMRQQRAEKKKDRIFDLVKLALGGAIALAFEHIGDIVALIGRFVHWIISL